MNVYHLSHDRVRDHADARDRTGCAVIWLTKKINGHQVKLVQIVNLYRVLVLGTTLTFCLAQIRNQRFVYVCVRGPFGLPKNLLDISPPFELPIWDYLGLYLGQPPSSKKLKIFFRKFFSRIFLMFLTLKMMRRDILILHPFALVDTRIDSFLFLSMFPNVSSINIVMPVWV